MREVCDANLDIGTFADEVSEGAVRMMHGALNNSMSIVRNIPSSKK